MPAVGAPMVTVEDYRNLPETGPRYQLIEGDLYILIYRPDQDPQDPVATAREGDPIESPLFPGLRVDTAEVFAQ